MSDTLRGIMSACVYLHHRHSREGEDPFRFEAHVFIVDIEDVLAKVPSSNPDQRCMERKGLRSSTAMFSYHFGGTDKYMIFSRQTYVSGFRYTSPIQSLVPEDPKSLRCFFICDFNPHRESPDPFPSTAIEVHDPEMNYPRSASEITDEV